MEPNVIHRNHFDLYLHAEHIAQQFGKSYAPTVSGGAGGHGTKISMAYGTRVGSGFVGGHDLLSIMNEKLTLQQLNERLATYLETVKTLEKANSTLEMKIREIIKTKGPLEGRNYSKYNAIITELRAKIYDTIRGKAQLAITLDNASLAAHDFRLKMEYEMSMRQTVDADVARLRKLLDDTNVSRLYLESDIESLKEELITLRKNHETDVAELRAKITEVGVRVDVDAPKGQDLARILEEMRASYEKIVLKNQRELKAWHETQIKEVKVQVTENTTALKEATTVISATRKKYQAMDIDLQAALSQNASLKANLRDIDIRFNMEVEKYNTVILRLKEELTQIRNNIQQNTRDYEQLLNIKMQLEAEIVEYRRLLDGGADFKLQDAVETKMIQTKVVTFTQTLVDGNVVSESKDIQSSEKTPDK
ncbi:keratin, type I cytoskeletal 18 [Etheostoma spectabile]|uniref:keratin, type I cytoskeletal 18 n=1 Tax=Etheostoma spectabile TaxID=54343 RepID=UPI0013AEADE3|nr:keratin, type I cytoskeletal 18-like [Etheostoma spectabile]